MLGRRFRASLAVVPIAVATTVFAVGSPASAACKTDWSNKGAGGRGQYTEEAAPLRSGPAEGCSSDKTLPASTALIYHCFVTNTAGNSWTHVKVQGQNLSGWIWDNHLKDNGSPYKC
ncbi:hypothetical protein [Micromonospora sp. DT233]|uniref:hypothetical protein n=1 Tax=Micromonospora sp. DT233 TaxID=3393432 RepID=UPI003CEC949D